MILPIGDAPNPEGYRPWVTWALMLANVAVYLAFTVPLSREPVDLTAPGFVEYATWLQLQVPELSLEALSSVVTPYDLFLFSHGYQPGRPSLVDLFSSLFLHAGVWHLLGNLLFLWIYGDNVEHRLGRLRFLVAYLGAGVAATLAYSAVAGPSLSPLVGASGAISGLLGFYFVFFPKNHVRLVVLLPPLLWRPVLVPARLVLGVYIVLDNVVPIVFQQGGNVAYGAHLGGFVAGACCALVADAAARRLPGSSQTAREGALGEAVRRGEAGPALSALRRAPRGEVSALSAPERLQLARWLSSEGSLGSAVALARPVARGGGPHAGRAALLVGEVRLAAGQPAAAYAWLVAAARQTEDPDTAAVAQAHVERLVG